MNVSAQHYSGETVTFYPQYDTGRFIKAGIALIFFVLVSAGCWVGVYYELSMMSGALLFTVISASFLLLIPLRLPYMYYRAVVLGDVITLRRFLIRDKVIPYASVKGIGLYGIETQVGRISLKFILNATDLMDLLEEKIQEQYPSKQVDPDLIETDFKELNWSIWLAIPSLIAAILAHFVIVYYHLLPFEIGKTGVGVIFFVVWGALWSAFFVSVRVIMGRSRKKMSDEKID